MSQKIQYSTKGRWTLEAPKLPEYFMNKVMFDFIAKTITFEHLEFIETDANDIIYKWSKSCPLGPFIFTTYNDKGKALAKSIFDDIELKSYKTWFDYEERDETSFIEIIVKFKNYSREIVYNKKEKARK